MYVDSNGVFVSHKFPFNERVLKGGLIKRKSLTTSRTPQTSFRAPIPTSRQLPKGERCTGQYSPN